MKKVFFFSSLRKNILDTLFPIHCLSCLDESSRWLCESCLDRIGILDQQLCPVCEKEFVLQGKICPSCRRAKSTFLDGLVVSTSYENPVVKKSIHYLKYRFVASLADEMGKIMARAILNNDLPVPNLIVPIPLHPRRLRWRGFNQSRLLAEKISEELIPFFKIPVSDFLERRIHNKPQMKVKAYRDRIKNVENVFCPGFKTDIIRGKSILLVDDIATTGATLQESAKVLKTCGVKKVMAVVIARQSMK